MPDIKKYEALQSELSEMNVTLVAVSKTKPNADIMEVYEAGHRDFGENKVQELADKAEVMPQDIRWHMIGHLQTNKVKYIAPFVHMVHAVDSMKLAREINKQAAKHGRKIACLLQVHIAQEDHKFGFTPDELREMVSSNAFQDLEHIEIHGLMAMATNTDDESLIHQEFMDFVSLFEELGSEFDENFTIKSIGMSGDWPLAVAAGGNMVRIGSSIFGARSYAK